MANRAIIYRLYPTASQKLLLTKTFGCCRFVYNRLLSVQQERYKNGEKHLSRTHANNFCNRQLKPAYPFLREVDKFALTNAIYHLEDGYLQIAIQNGHLCHVRRSVCDIIGGQPKTN